MVGDFVFYVVNFICQLLPIFIRFAEKMTLHERLSFLGVVYWIVLLLILVVMIAPLIPRVRSLHPSWRYLLAIIVTWIFTDFFRVRVQLPILLAMHSDDPLYDGVGGNVVTMVFGWIPGMLLGLPVFCFFLWRWRRCHKTRAESGRVSYLFC